ncbi:MAG: hypothetical protein JWO56_1343 [Acidobacteria bacterium]|nr:hypothetical protein [Acidobacteriota bacterium]
MARTAPAAVLLLTSLLLPSIATADTPRFHFAVASPVKFTMKQTTIVLDDDTNGIPHRLVAVETSAVSLVPVEKGYLLTKQPTNFEVLVDGHHVDAGPVETAMKASTISMTIDERGLARKAAGYESVQSVIGGSSVAGRILQKDLASRDVAAWNDRMLLLNQRADRGAEWQMHQRDGTVRTWMVAGTEPCGAASECTTIRSKWDADSDQLLKRANTNAVTPLSAARLSVHFDLLVDAATLLPRYEKKTSEQFISIPKGRKSVERRITKIDEVDYKY